MRFLTLLLTLSSFTLQVVYGGVGVTTPEIEREALRLWAAYCGGASEGGTDGSTFIYCKRSRDNYEETLQHTVEIPRGPEAQQQVVFVQPPSYHYKHDVVVSGGGGSAPKTVIYVKPSKNTHEVNVQDQTLPNAAPQKPTLYFLKGSHGGEANEEFASQPQKPPPQQQGYVYAPPSRGLRYN